MYTILVSIFTICFFLNEFKWKQINPNGFVKSNKETSLIIETYKENKSKKKKPVQETMADDYSFLDINLTP